MGYNGLAMDIVKGFPALLAAVTLFAQTATFHEDTLHGRRAFVLENDQMRVSTLPGGGFVGEIRS